MGGRRVALGHGIEHDLLRAAQGFSAKKVEEVDAAQFDYVDDRLDASHQRRVVRERHQSEEEFGADGGERAQVGWVLRHQVGIVGPHEGDIFVGQRLHYLIEHCAVQGNENNHRVGCSFGADYRYSGEPVWGSFDQPDVSEFLQGFADWRSRDTESLGYLFVAYSVAGFESAVMYFGYQLFVDVIYDLT